MPELQIAMCSLHGSQRCMAYLLFVLLCIALSVPRSKRAKAYSGTASSRLTTNSAVFLQYCLSCAATAAALNSSRYKIHLVALRAVHFQGARERPYSALCARFRGAGLHSSS
jgi:hypothetical protein